MATVTRSKRTFYLAEVEEAEESQSGFCLACGAMRDMCEPDAEKYPCEECGENEVHGPHWIIISGFVR